MLQGELATQDSKVVNMEKLLKKIRNEKSKQRDRTRERE